MSRVNALLMGPILAFTLGLTSCTLPTPVAPVTPERVILELEPLPGPQEPPAPEPEALDPVQERIDEAISNLGTKAKTDK